MRRKALDRLLLAALLLAAPAAAAQPMMKGGGGGMPDLSQIVGRPLPDRGMPTGTVSVRVARKMPANAVAGSEVSAIIKTRGAISAAAPSRPTTAGGSCSRGWLRATSSAPR